MLNEFKRKTKEEKKEVVKTVGKFTLGAAGVGALGWFLGALWGQKNFLNQLFEAADELNRKEDSGEVEIVEEGEA